ncbi:cell division ATP-binding protein FtsE [Candidatus Daviesbacteria bacterium RIFCSPHIGHO2_12_FULL_37_11]|uniref:Cell division ATP-binding protein FtsE n=1 Tax=Candidatus Daviesbacteria bacterium RIFCSPHIGHO2_12_FULL_37_11 TaxID=1797777 RepID=A0A1F5KB38_9BACT|nr:MAG: cell division ATP-binding protein FtsE [Candidatus Daviesbacteria bacterium RIFCSPHIGHO2_01_FULL_37_27]OGE38068.1 MAG: cell division ATP-binding protein FtsE [Candidatus Daviesbacteria bacterium RIFCSPHIGHO2_12_FULL_37_11]OGE44922.1 MAG: cell division ATP-binding protein FtsE [Candidatus Daviesbacteria bacterium RIFCSPLOWO2_01_FULL_37_10]
MIKFEAVTKKFGNLLALDDINLEVKQGEFVFLVGPSGAGKSTLLRILTKEVSPTSGKVFLSHIDITKIPDRDVPKYRRKIGFVFQDFKLLDDRTVFENVALTLEVLGRSEDEIKKGVEHVLKLVEIWDKRNLFPKQLSGGEAQRTAIARAIVGKPDILLADEPTGDLDPKTAWGVIQLLNEINTWGTTILMATHNAEIVNTLKRRVIILKNGKITKDSKEGKYE